MAAEMRRTCDSLEMNSLLYIIQMDMFLRSSSSTKGSSCSSEPPLSVPGPPRPPALPLRPRSSARNSPAKPRALSRETEKETGANPGIMADLQMFSQ